METEEAYGSLILKYYLDEAKHSRNDLHLEDFKVPNEAEQATDFLQSVGLSNLSKVYQEGNEISENLVNDTVRQRNLTQKQAQTVRSRVRTLNTTLKSRQPRRKHRQDIRDVTWNAETSSTGSRSRSATPDSLDSIEVHRNEPSSSDDDQQLLSLPTFPLDHGHNNGFKTKVKPTSSVPLQNKKFNRTDKGDIAHLGSDNVVLKGYHQLTENGTLTRPPQRERSGSDPTTDVLLLQPLQQSESHRDQSTYLHNQISRSHNSITLVNHCSSEFINADESVSFEGMMRQNDNPFSNQSWEIKNGMNVDELSDGEYQFLKPLLYVELVAIFDQYKLDFVKRKASNKIKGGNVFGASLSTLIMRDMPRPTENSMIPKIFQIIIDQLNTRCLNEDGILRIAGQKQKLEILYNEIETKFYNNRKEVDLLLSQATAHELTGTLKKLLRDLPDPVFTVELFDMFYKTSRIPNSDDQMRALNLLVLMLPIEHRNTYRYIQKFLCNIIENEKNNRMNLHNVAMITAPSFFPPRLLLPKDINKVVSKEDVSKQVKDAAVSCQIMETMLKAGDNLWFVPLPLATQASEAQKKAQDKKVKICKTKLVRSSTQYEPRAKT